MEWIGLFAALAVVLYVTYAAARPAPPVTADFDTRKSEVDLPLAPDAAAELLAQDGPAGTRLVAREGTTLVFDQGRGATMMGAFYRVRLSPAGAGGSRAEIAMKTRAWEVGASVTRAQEQFVAAVRAAVG